MSQKDSGWKYYVPDQGEDTSDATRIMIYYWQNVFDAEDAAEHAAEDEWDNRDGWEAGIGEGPKIAVIAPDGTETRFTTEREARIRHTVTEALD